MIWLNSPRTCGRWFLATLAVMQMLAMVMFAPAADARGGGHGFGHGFGHGGRGGMGRVHWVGGRKMANDDHATVASKELDTLLSTKLKSICKGC